MFVRVKLGIKKEGGSYICVWLGLGLSELKLDLGSALYDFFCVNLGLNSCVACSVLNVYSRML